MQLIGVFYFVIEVEAFVSKSMPLVFFVSSKSIFKSYLVGMLCDKYCGQGHNAWRPWSPE